MHRTVTALYDTKAQAERARDALVAAKLGDHVTIRDRDDAGEHRNFGEWLSHLFGHHEDKHVYGEGVRRGHVLLSAKVDDLNEIRAAEILDALEPVDLPAAEKAWRSEGWTPPAAPAQEATTETLPNEPTAETGVPATGVSVRSYYVLTEG